MGATLQSQTLGISIERPLDEVYAFVSVPENFLKWATGLGSSMKRSGEEWVADTPEGPMRARFTEPNRFGVVDHYLYPEQAATIYVPMRVIANGGGCDVMLTLFRQPGASDEKFAADADWVRRDLSTLKALIEGKAAGGVP